MTSSSDTRIPRLDRALVALAAPSWRSRYAEEFTALLEDTAPSPRRTANIGRATAGSWLRPPAHVVSGSRRLLVSTATSIWAWTALTASVLSFAQFSEDRPLRDFDSRHAAARAFYLAFEITSALGATVLVLGCAPLALTMWRGRDTPASRRDRLLLASPLVGIAGFAAVLAATTNLAPHSPTPERGIGGWIVVLLVAGVAAGAVCAAGPTRVLLRDHNVHIADGAALRVALVAAALGTLGVALGGCAALGYGLVLHAQSAPFDVATIPFLTAFGVWVLIAATGGAVTTVRGVRAMRAPA